MLLYLIYIIGHYLNITDKDILRNLILYEYDYKGEKINPIVTIYYHDKKAYKNQIINMVKLIGQDELINRVHSANPSIIFKNQSELRKE